MEGEENEQTDETKDNKGVQKQDKSKQKCEQV